ncbi:transglutaminaseTgpA domain-containing protein [Nocardiopsis sp. NPDC050513]|uniref:transglutaminase family protein n=1 Tax=Nocardiopsis sp. NPDC050513 TaxID=3364338 RepID=UPI0037ADCA35
MPLATLFSLVAAVPLLGTVVTGTGWWVPAVVMMTAVAGASALYRLSGWTSLAVPFLQILVAAVLLTPLFVADTAVLGLIPTRETLPALGDLLNEGVDAINVSAPPVTGTPGVALIVALALAVLVGAADFLAVTARCPGMVGALLVALLAVPLVVHDGGVTAGAAVSAAVGFLALLAVDMWLRGREWGMPVPDPAARVPGGLWRAAAVTVSVAAAVLVALAVPLAAPSLGTGAIYGAANGSPFGDGPTDTTTTHPLVSLNRDLSSDSDRTVLTYTTDAEEPDYLRMYVLDEFDGVNWTMSPVGATRDTRMTDELPLPTGWTAEPDGATSTTRVSLDAEAPSMDFLPVPYWPRSVDVSGEWYADPDSLMVFTTDAPRTGLSFTVESATRTTSVDALADAGNARSVPDAFLDLPAGVDPRVEELTQAVTSGAGSPYERALALQEFFRDGSFDYSLTPPPVPEGVDPLAHFLFEDQVGYCQQFAGTMAVMARQAGIPARVATGYTAGQRMGDGRWAVSSGDAHAWPELYFEGVGWVRFEPTPDGAGGQGQGTATVPDYTSGESGGAPTDERTDPEGEESESPESEPSATAGPESDGPEESAAPESGEEDGTAAASGSDADAGSVPVWLPVAGAVLAAVLLAALPALVRIAVRGSRTAAVAGGAPVPAAHAAWRELRDTCLDLGIAWDLAESPRGTAERLAPRGPVPDDVRAALWRLALGEESARYAPEPAVMPGAREDLAAARAGLAAASGRAARVRALLLPRSLAPWNRPRPDAPPVPTTA